MLHSERGQSGYPGSDPEDDTPRTSCGPKAAVREEGTKVYPPLPENAAFDLLDVSGDVPAGWVRVGLRADGVGCLPVWRALEIGKAERCYEIGVQKVLHLEKGPKDDLFRNKKVPPILLAVERRLGEVNGEPRQYGKQKKGRLCAPFFNTAYLEAYDDFFHLIVQPMALVEEVAGFWPLDKASIAAST